MTPTTDPIARDIATQETSHQDEALKESEIKTVLFGHSLDY